MKQKYYLGIDLGGTKIISGVTNKKGKLLSNPVKVSTLADEPPEYIINRMIESVELTLKNANLTIDSISCIGIGSPGPLDIENGVILNTPNLPTLNNYPVRDKIEDILKVKVLINNDANCFVLGESLFGAGKNSQIVFGVTLGTGFGSGIVINKRIFNLNCQLERYY